MPRKRQQQKSVKDIKPTDIPGLTYLEKARHPLTRRVLHSLVNAEFPRDLDRFAQFDEIFRQTDTGRVVIKQWWIGVKLVSKFKYLTKYETPPSPLFLPLLQTHLLKTECAELRNETDRTESPKTEELEKELRNEFNPLRRAELEDRIEKERAVVEAVAENRKVKLQEQLTRCLMKVMQHKHQDRTPHRPKFRLWFEPMTAGDYVEATAVSRKTIEEFLGIRKSRKGQRQPRAKPLNMNKKVNEPFIYGMDTNLRILRQWLCVWLKDVEKCRTCTACTLAYCKVHSPDRVNKLLRALAPDFGHTLERICPAPESFDKLVKEVQELVRYYSPPPQPDFDLSNLYSLESSYNPLSAPRP